MSSFVRDNHKRYNAVKMSRFSDNNAFSLLALGRAVLSWLAIGLVAIWAVTCVRWQPKKYSCYAGWHTTWSQTKILDYGSLQLFSPTAKRDCLLGPHDRYDPKAYLPAGGGQP